MIAPFLSLANHTTPTNIEDWVSLHLDNHENPLLDKYLSSLNDSDAKLCSIINKGSWPFHNVGSTRKKGVRRREEKQLDEGEE